MQNLYQEVQIEIEGRNYRVVLAQIYMHRFMEHGKCRVDAQRVSGPGQFDQVIDFHWCGYVDVGPFNLPEDFDQETLEVHGGITFSGGTIGDMAGDWIGFDCCHYNDYPIAPLPRGRIWTQEEVIAECRSLIQQLIQPGSD